MTRFKYLDGLRGVAALMVVFHHYANSFFPYTYDRLPDLRMYWIEKLFIITPLQLFIAGNFAVCIFFVLSGFVLSHRIFAMTTPFKVIPEYCKRFVRLWIPTAFAVLFSYVLFSLLGFKLNRTVAFEVHSEWLSGMWYFKDSFGYFVRNILYEALLYGDNSYNSSLWTMQRELFYSFILFVSLWAFRKKRWRIVVYVIAICLSVKSFFLSFLLGIALADLHIHYYELVFNSRLIKRLLPLIWLSGIMFGSYSILYNLTANVNFMKYWTMTGIEAVTFGNSFGAGLIVLAILLSGRAQRVLTTRIALFLGRISLPLYLFHLPILATLSSYTFLVLHDNYHLPYFISVVSMFVFSFVVLAQLSYWYARYIDEPTVRFSRKVGATFYKWQSYRIQNSGNTDTPVPSS